MICPMMSKNIVRPEFNHGINQQTGDTLVEFFPVECKKEDCALWVSYNLIQNNPTAVDIIKTGKCGLIYKSRAG